MKLEIDQGNTRTKWRLVASQGITGRGVELNTRPVVEWLPNVRGALVDDAALQVALLASVAKGETKQKLIDGVASEFGVDVKVAKTEACRTVAGQQLTNLYDDPSRMGVDRWLAVVAAVRSYPGRAVVVVDAGSAINVEVVSPAAEYLGGYIVPGVSMMQSVLLNNTGQVVFERAEKAIMAPGRNTAAAVANGVGMAALGLVEQVLRYARQQWGEAQVLVTGGDGAMLLPMLPGAVHRPDLVMDGLSEVAVDYGRG